MRKALVCAVALVATTVAANAAPIGFSGYYAPANWTTTLSGNNNGSVNTAGAPNSITLNGSNGAAGGGGANVDYTITAPVSGLVSFDWLFDGEPVGGITGPAFDPFGYLINGVFTQLTNNGGTEVQSGSASFFVNAGDTFGFRQNSTDNAFGPGITVVSNFNAPTPEPISMVDDIKRLLPLLAPSGFIWVSWPKKASKVPTDISEDTIREVALPLGLVDVKVCAVDATWSGLKLMKRRKAIATHSH